MSEHIPAETITQRRRRLILEKLKRSFPGCDREKFMDEPFGLLSNRLPRNLIRSQSGFDELMETLNTVKP